MKDSTIDLFHHCMPGSQVRLGTIRADPSWSDTGLLPAYEWLAEQIGFSPIGGTWGTSSAISRIFFLYKFLVRDPGKQGQCAPCAPNHNCTLAIRSSRGADNACRTHRPKRAFILERGHPGPQQITVQEMVFLFQWKFINIGLPMYRSVSKSFPKRMMPP